MGSGIYEAIFHCHPSSLFMEQSWSETLFTRIRYVSFPLTVINVMSGQSCWD